MSSKKPNFNKRQLIIAIVGESGSGKTNMESHLMFFLNILPLSSYTDRPKREPNESGHIFITENEFDAINESDMIAFTQYGIHRYCCLQSDIKKLNSYVISEDGMEMLLKRLDQAKYLVKSIRIVCSEQERLRRAGVERVNRDKGRFNIPYSDFDIIYNSEKYASIIEDEVSLEKIKSWIKEVK